MNKITNERQFVEGSILAILTRATHEQAYMLKDEFKMKLKQDFNMWLRNGERVCKPFEHMNNELELDNLTDAFHLAMQEVRENLTEYFRRNEQLEK